VILGRAASVGVCSLAVMSASQMRVEDRLAGASNWSSWKARMVFVLEDLELWDIVRGSCSYDSFDCSHLGRRNIRRRTTRRRGRFLMESGITSFPI
jgi:hypothetical protein